MRLAIFDIDGTLTRIPDPEQLGGGVICFGKCWIHGKPVTPRARFTAAIPAGASSLVVDRMPMNWAPCDVLHLTHPVEDVTIASTDYSNLFIVIPTPESRPTVLRLRY